MNYKAIDYLPLGSVVLLKGSEQKVIIIGRGLLTTSVNSKMFKDYGGVLYPYGIIGENIMFFNHNDIDKVVFKGYKDEADSSFVKKINESVSKIEL